MLCKITEKQQLASLSQEACAVHVQDGSVLLHMVYAATGYGIARLSSTRSWKSTTSRLNMQD